MSGAWNTRRIAELLISSEVLCDFLGLPKTVTIRAAAFDKFNDRLSIYIEGPELPTVGGKAAAPRAELRITQTLDGDRLQLDSALEIQGRTYGGRTWWVANPQAPLIAPGGALGPEHVKLLQAEERLSAVQITLSNVTAERDELKEEVERQRGWLQRIAQGNADPTALEEEARTALGGAEIPEEGP